jgi:hypothetical protein
MAAEIADVSEFPVWTDRNVGWSVPDWNCSDYAVSRSLYYRYCVSMRIRDVKFASRFVNLLRVVGPQYCRHAANP